MKFIHQVHTPQAVDFVSKMYVFGPRRILT